MKARRPLAMIVLLALGAAVTAPAAAQRACPAALDFSKRLLDGDETVNLCERYRGKVVLIVNTASKCGFTPQYEGLEALHERYGARGLVVLGFPSNDFGGQEPGTERQIQQFCRLTYGVRFPMFEKTRAAKDGADEMYRVLAEQAGGSYPRWNFHKYLLDREGRVAHSFDSRVEPLGDEMLRAIEALL